MKVLYLITRAERGGAQVHVLDLIRGFRDQFNIEVAAGEDGFFLEKACQFGATCHVVPGLVQPIDALNDLRALREIVALLRKRRPDVVHAHTSKAGILGRLGAWICGIPSIFTAHAWSFTEGTSLKRKLLGVPFERLAAMSGGPIINVSNANRRLALQYRIASEARLVTIHNGVPDTEFNCPIARPSPPTIIMVARFAPPKEQAMLLEVCARIKVPFRLQFAGAGPAHAEVQRRAQQLGITGRVEFLGDCSDVPERLREASIFALATNWEGFPLSILEAMRAALPIVASDVGGVGEAVTHGENGFLAERGDWGAFQQGLERLLIDEALRIRMARKSRSLFKERFTEEQMLRKTFNLYRDVISSRVGKYETSSGSESGEPFARHHFSKR